METSISIDALELISYTRFKALSFQNNMSISVSSENNEITANLRIFPTVPRSYVGYLHISTYKLTMKIIPLTDMECQIMACQTVSIIPFCQVYQRRPWYSGEGLIVSPFLE